MSARAVNFYYSYGGWYDGLFKSTNRNALQAKADRSSSACRRPRQSSDKKFPSLADEELLERQYRELYSWGNTYIERHLIEDLNLRL